MTVHLVDQHRWWRMPHRVRRVDPRAGRAAHGDGRRRVRVVRREHARCRRRGRRAHRLVVRRLPAWNRIRRDLLHDPRYGPYAAALAGLRRGGTRRFYPPLIPCRKDARRHPSAGGPHSGAGRCSPSTPPCHRRRSRDAARHAGMRPLHPGDPPLRRSARTPRAHPSTWCGRPPTSRSRPTAPT